MAETMMDFQKEQTRSGIRYTLPPRIATPKLRFAGGFFIVLGLAIALFACGWMWSPLQDALGDPSSPIICRIFDGIFVVFGLILLGAGLAMILGGIAFIVGGSHCRIELEAHRLSVREQFAFLYWTFRRKRKDISALVLGSQVEWNFPGCDFIAQCPGENSMMIAPGYPIPLIRRLAQELHHEMPEIPLLDSLSKQQVSQEHFPQLTPNPSILPSEKPSFPDPGPIPPGVLCDIRSDGVTLDVLAPGIWKGARFFVIFSSLWLFITAAVTIPMVFAIVLGKPIQSEDGGQVSPWFILPFLSLFWAVGLGMLAAAVHIGTRRTTIFLGDGLLALTVISRLRRWHQQWSLEEMREVKIGPSGALVNDRPIPCLHLIVGDKTVKILTAWNEETERRLEWICAALSTAPVHRNDMTPTDMPSSLRLDPNKDDWAVVPVFVRKDNGAWGMLGVSVFILFFVAGFLSLVYFVFKPDGSGQLIVGSVMGLFAVAGLGVFFWSLWALTVRRRIAITTGRLSIHEGHRHLDLDRSEIQAVLCELNGTKAGVQKFYRLAIQKNDGTTWTCLSNRPEVELRWLTAELNRRLEKFPQRT